ncbi:uncharacterized protein EV154DRAFT_497864 [Mucor mucedo]|uniref:uncharacterized protein n=1 Tax=Mucor mucedo TaxID=29922 RepID=UPI00221E539F|nr:uncharacterized protein EV154DRAFT_497864 [Mucor mucedo]KAI7894752.1 hypothetical protein EV154DRAFT_497864 [Mucor mucedo]
MGCCISHSYFEKGTVHEVTLDADGVAQRVPKGQGTHFIHISPNNETHLEEKSDQPSLPAPTHNNDTNKWPSLTTPPSYNSKVAPSSEIKEEKPTA